MQLECDFLSCHTLPQINVHLSICTYDKKGWVGMNSPQHQLNRSGWAHLICGGNIHEDKPVRTEAIILLYVGNRPNKRELGKTVMVWMQKNILKG
jgi:hypothetical protein